MLKLSAGHTTMIGSMPQNDPNDAFASFEKYPLSLPTWPQFPKISFKEAMIPQYSEGFPGIKVDEIEKKIWVEKDDNLVNNITDFFEKSVAGDLDAFAISDNYACGFSLFIEYMKQKNQKLSHIKGQLTGPFTFGLGLNDQDSKAVWFDEMYREVVINGIKMKALWQANQLKQVADNVVLFFDEPVLSALGTPAYISIQDEDVINIFNEIITPLHEQDIAVGVHCCGNMDWGLLAKTDLDIIAFDAYFFGDKVALYPQELSNFLDQGGYLAWGIVPTSEAELLHKINVDNLKQKRNDLFSLFSQKGMNENRIKSQILYTPSCGMGSGSLTSQESEIILKLLSELQDHQ